MVLCDFMFACVHVSASFSVLSVNSHKPWDYRWQTDVSFRNLRHRWAPSFPTAPVSFERWCNPSPRVISCQITWATPTCPVPCRIHVMVTQTGVVHTRVNTPTQTSQTTQTLRPLVCRAASVTYQSWKCVPSRSNLHTSLHPSSSVILPVQAHFRCILHPS